MGKKLLSIIALLGLFIVSGYLFYTLYLSEKVEIKKEIEEVSQEIQELAHLGFGNNSHAVQLLIGFQDWLLTDRSESNAVWDLSKLALLHRTILKSYLYDMQDSKKNGVIFSKKYQQFVYNNMVRLTISLSELEKNSDIPQEELQKKYVRIKEIAKQSFQYALREFQGLKINESFLHDQLTEKIRTWQILERLVS